MSILYVKANPKRDEDSFSAQLANHFIDSYLKNNPNDTVEKLDLYNEDIPFLDVDIFSAWGKFADHKELNPTELEKAQKMDELTNQFLNADKVIIAAPFWNLSFPPMLKAYIDTICIKGKTFHYTEEGRPEGLVPDKPCLLIETRGGIYSEGPAAELEFSQRYLKTILNFIGVQSFTAVTAEGLDIDEETRKRSLQEAKAKLTDLSQTF